MGSPESNLWVCHECELIGSRAEATDHHVATKHPVEMLDSTTTAAVRELQLRASAERAAAFRAFAQNRAWSLE